jgi:hypothetical protein
VLADEGADDRRRCFVGTQAVIVARTGNAGTKHIGIGVDGRDGIDEEGEERMFSFGVLAGFSRFTPVLVARLQLLCLPLPFTPA